MTPNEGTAINIGAAIRDGIQLRTVEVVALLHNACQQLEAGTAATLHRSIDDIWVTDEGKVVLPRIARVEPPRATVALLLEELLPKPGEGAAVPAALRSLPARLREAGSGDQPTDLNDLLTILRWHLPAESQEVLRDLVVRARLNTPQIEVAPVIETFAAERPVLIPGAVPAAAPVAALVPTAVVATVPAPAVVAVRPPAAAIVATRPRKVRPFPASLVAALILLAMGVAGYASYRYTSSRIDLDTTTTATAAADAAPIQPLPGRITRSGVDVQRVVDTPRVETPRVDAAPEVGDKPAPVALNAHALDLPLAGGVFSPSFASSGTALVFHAGRNNEGRLFQASLDARGRPSAVKPLLDEPGRTYHARLAPDGKWVAFDSDRDGERGVYLASLDGAKVARVSGDGFAAVPSWSPDMKWLAFVRGEGNRPQVWNLWLRDVASGALTRQTSFRSGQVWGASWFPGGRGLCYSHEDRLIVTQLGSKETRTFESPVKGRLIRTPAVSPDGARVIFQVYRDGAWLLDMKTGEMRRLLADPSAEEFAWDPDGTHIAYHSRRDGEWRIWMLTV